MTFIAITFFVMVTIGNLFAAKVIIDEDFLKHPFWTRSIRSLLLIPPFAMIYMITSGLIELIKEAAKWTKDLILSYITKRTDI